MPIVVTMIILTNPNNKIIENILSVDLLVSPSFLLKNMENNIIIWTAKKIVDKFENE
jgi:hypothetical protein